MKITSIKIIDKETGKELEDSFTDEYVINLNGEIINLRPWYDDEDGVTYRPRVLDNDKYIIKIESEEE